MAISLSDYLGVDRSDLDREGCFDTILDLDSLMFVNFLRVRDSETPEIIGAYNHISKLFKSIGKLLNASKTPFDRFWKEAYRLLEMSEFEEICMGYSQNGTSGSGSGDELKRKILTTGKEIITAGVLEPEIFELVGLFEDNIGPDRISDFIARTIKDYLKLFSLRVLKNFNINNETRSDISFCDGLILNPFNNKLLYLLPKDLLHELPVAREWEDISLVCGINQTVRDEINAQIGEDWKDLTVSAQKAAARRVLMSNPELIRQLVSDYRNFDLDPYDFSIDPLGESSWYLAAKEIASRLPLDIPQKKITNITELKNVVLLICNKYKELIEVNGLNEILYAGGKARKERIAQRLFFGIADSYCKANDLDISPETNSGRGAVDFKFSNGYMLRTVVEIKLTTNNKLIPGYTKQIEEYKRAERNSYAIYLVIDNGGPEKRLIDIVALHNEHLSAGVNNCDLILIDGIIRPTASKV